jgi:integrase
MNTVADTFHLWQRGQAYYFRRKVPKHLVERAKTPVVQYSLGTTDKTEAKKRARIEDVKFDRWLADVEAGRGAPCVAGASNLSAPRRISVAEWTAYVREYVSEQDVLRRTRCRDRVPDPENDISDEDVIEKLRYEQSAIRKAMDGFRQPDAERWISQAVTEVSKRVGAEIDLPMPFGLYNFIGRGLQEIARRQEARFTQGYSPEFYDPDFAPRAPGATTKVGGMSFRQLGDAYVAFKKTGKWADTTEADMQRVRTLVYRVIDADKPARDISIDDVRKVRDAIATMPVGTLRPKKAKKGAEPPKALSFATQEKNFRFFKAILKWGVDEGHLDTMPGAGVKLAPAQDAGEAGRDPYSPNQLRVIFASPLFTGVARVALTARHEPGPKIIRDGWYWVPLIGVYTGMRAGEIVQLLTADVKTEGGITFFDVSKGGSKRLKTSGSARRIPVPQVLLDLGFAGVVAEADPKGRLFPEIRMGEGNGNSAVFTQFWTRYGRSVGFHTPKTVFHSFRHNFTDALREAEVPDFIQHVLTGHKSGSVHEGYGAGPSLAKLKEAIDKVVYPTIDIKGLGWSTEGKTSG